MTGVGGTEGIGFAISRRLLDQGFRVLVHSLDGAPVDELGGASDHLRSIEAGSAWVTGQVIDAEGGFRR